MNNFEQEYRNAMSDIHASDELRNKVLNMKPAKRTVTPFKTTLVSVAAAVMILVVANDYDFTPNTDGVINETVVSTQVPETEFHAVVTETPEKTVYVKPKTDTPKTEGVVQNANEGHGAEEDYAPMVARHGLSDVTAETWEINRYFEYIGINVHNKINAVIKTDYVGENSFEFVTDESGVPVQDMVIFNYITTSGANINVMVSKMPIFEANLSGNVVSSESGYNGYKVADGVYYMITTSGISHDGIIALVNNF